MAWIVPGNVALNQSQMDNNAWEMYNYYRNLSNPWTVESIAALCGNAQLESTINPARVNSSGYTGLTQLGGTRKTTMLNWLSSNGFSSDSGPGQTRYIEYERANPSATESWYHRGGYTNSFSDFAYNTQSWSLEDLTYMFQYCYERNSFDPQTQRYTYAQHYWSLFQSTPPGPDIIELLIMRKHKMFWKPGGRRYIGT